MPRRPLADKQRHPVKPDYKYDSKEVGRFINYIMEDGKKAVARKILYDAFEIIKKKEKTDDPVKIFEEALKNVGPFMEVRSRRIGGANYQVPREVESRRRTQLAMRWILKTVRSGKGQPIAERLADELIAASKEEGNSVKMKETSHRMAEANKAFAHFSW